MSKDTSLITVALAVHVSIVEDFRKQPLADEQIISNSIRSEYDIITLETIDYMKMIPTILQNMPFMKVIMPIELDTQIRKYLADYDTHDLSKYIKVN